MFFTLNFSLMKKAIFLFSFLFAIGSLFSCSDDDDGGSAPTLSFAKSSYFLPSDEPVEVEIICSAAVQVATTVKFSISGTAEKGVDYTLSAEEFVIPAGGNSAKITVTPKNNLEENRQIILSLQNMEGYALGSTNKTTISVEPKEPLIYSFEYDYYALMQEIVVTVNLTQIEGAFTAKQEYHLPFSIDAASTAVEGTHFEIEGGVKEFVVPVGAHKAEIKLKYIALEEEKDEIVLKMEEQSKPFIVGTFDKTTVKIYGPTTVGKMLGKWTFEKETTFDFRASEWGNFYPSSDFENMPRNNLSTDTLEFVPGEEDMMKIHMTGDLKNYFRDCTVKFLREETEVLNEQGTMPPPRVQMSVMELSNVNVAFSANTISERAAECGFRVLDDGVTLEVTVYDYEPVDFMVQVYEGNKTIAGEGEIPMRLAQLRYYFKKVIEE